MRTRFLIKCCFLYTGFACFLTGRLHADDALPTLIFDGSSLDGWEGDSRYWSVRNGAITGTIPTGDTLRQNQFLFYKNDIHDFELSLEFRIEGAASANSGIQFRSQRRDDGGAAGYQADLDLGDVWLGRIYDEHGRELLVERGSRVSIAPDGRKWNDSFATPESFRRLAAPGQWHRYRIKATGPHVEVWINDRLWSVLDDHQKGEADYSGRLGLQLHSGPGPVEVQFKDVQLTHLGKTAMPKSDGQVASAGNRQTQSPVLWHLRPNPTAPIKIDNSQAQATVAGMMLTDGFRAELIAAEPDLQQPIAFTFDERGRLWIVEAFSYPNRQPEGQGKDRILILEDGDGDGSFESKKTFATGLNLVSGIEVGFGGVWLGAAPELLFIPDRNRDDRPDGPPEVLLNGFGYQDTHETLNSLIWGPDGWLYGNQGVFNTAKIGKPSAGNADRVELRAGIWRYHPTKHLFEVFSHGGSNQWGLDFNDVGHLFMTHCRSYWGGGGTTYVIQNGHFWNQTNSNYPDFISNSAPERIPHLKNFLPASAKYDSGEGGAGKPGTNAVYGGHSHVGTMIYLGDNFPAIYRDRLFTHNLHGHQMNQQVNVREGSAYETMHAGYDLMHVPDPAYVAVGLKYGPDGAVYINDWVDPQHCHNPRAEIWDRTNGRMYRVSWAASYHPVKVDLGKNSDRELVELQSHSNRWYARTAQRLLHERSAKSIEDGAVRLMRGRLQQTDPGETLRGLWSLYVTQQLSAEDIQVALRHNSDIVRAWAVRLATDSPRDLALDTNQLLALAQRDSSPVVRLALASALPKLSNDQCWAVGSALAMHSEDVNDRFLPKMIWYGLANRTAAEPKSTMQLAERTPIVSLADSMYWYSAQQAEGRSQLVGLIAESNSTERAEHLLRLLHFGLKNEARVAMPNDWSKVQARFANGQAAIRRMVDELAVLFGDTSVVERMRATIVDRSFPRDARRNALAILKRVSDVSSSEAYLSLLDDAQLRSDVIPLLGRIPSESVAPKLLGMFTELNDNDRVAALGVLTSRPASSLMLLQAVDRGSFDRKHLTALQISQMHLLMNQEVDALLEKVWGKIGTSTTETQIVIAKLRDTYEAAPLWAFSADRGRQTFQKNCAACHPLDGTTVPLGPSLVGSHRNGLNYFLENIVDPNAVVGENYRTTVILNTNGLVVTGLLDSESETSVVLRTAEKLVTIPKSEIEQRRLGDQSLMPIGLLDKMTEIEIIELLKFLTQPR